MLPPSHHTPTIWFTFALLFLITLQNLVRAFVIDANSLTDASQQQQFAKSQLSSKLIYQSPSMENVYKEFIVSSKPLNLRKYSNRPKTKKTKKDSRIFYIPIPPLPYRYIPGVGYDYQPMKIKPLLVDPPEGAAEFVEMPMPMENVAYQKQPPQYNYNSNYQQQQQLQNSYYQSLPPSLSSAYLPAPIQSAASRPILPIAAQSNKQPFNSIHGTESPAALQDSKIYRVDRNDYYFNGKPFRLQVAHAAPKYNLTPQNLKSSFYFNKNIIY